VNDSEVGTFTAALRQPFKVWEGFETKLVGVQQRAGQTKDRITRRNPAIPGVQGEVAMAYQCLDQPVHRRSTHPGLQGDFGHSQGLVVGGKDFKNVQSFAQSLHGRINRRLGRRLFLDSNAWLLLLMQ
jgi:hypothetical protein